MTHDPTSLRDKRVLILEDDYYLATDLQAAIERAGAIVIGPFGDVAEAEQALIKVQPDCAFVDVNLGQGPTFVIPRALVRRDVPFAFVTGYDEGTIPAEFSDAMRFQKPVVAERVVQGLARMLNRG